MRVALGVIALVGCGRVDFDPRGDATAADATMTSNACGPLAGQVACLLFDGDTNDHSGAGNHATGAITYVTGARGLAGLFGDAVDLRIMDSPSMDFRSAMTIRARIRISAVPGTGRAILADRDFGFAFAIFDAGVLALTSYNGLDAVDDVPLALDTWHEVVGTYDGTEAVLYSAGVPIASAAFAMLLPADDTNGTRVGGNLGTPADAFQGAIDELAIWDRALDTDELCVLAGTC